MWSNIIVGIVVGTIASFLSYVYVENNDFTKHAGSEISSVIFGTLNLPALVVVLVTWVDNLPFFLFLVFVQWFLLGFGGIALYQRIRARNNPN